MTDGRIRTCDGRIRPLRRLPGVIYLSNLDSLSECSEVSTHVAFARRRPRKGARRKEKEAMSVRIQDRVAQDPHAQLRSLYQSLIRNQEHFDEFKQLLGSYPTMGQGDEESDEALALRETLNARIKEWVNGPFDGLSATQVILWRAIVVDERFNVALSPWKESNAY
jgi:hypothetical protein